MNGKNLYIETIKAYAIIFVVFVHIGGTIDYARSIGCYESAAFLDYFDVISRCGVPLFFSISAYLLFRKPFDEKKNIKKKIRTLVIPYFTWMAIWIFLFQIGWWLVGSEFENVLAWDAKEWVVGIIGIPFLETPFYPALWYVRDLFLLNIIAPAFSFAAKKLGAVKTFLVAILIWLIPLSEYFCEAFAFFAIGMVVALFPEVKEKFIYIKSKKVFLGIFAVFVILETIFRQYIVMQKIEIALLCVLFLNVFKLPQMKNNKIVQIISPNVFMILVLHHKIIAMFSIVARKILPANNSSMVLIYFLLPLLTITLCVVVSELLKRYNMKLYNFLTAGR